MLVNMRKVTNDFINRIKVQILDGASWLALAEREEFYSELCEWAHAEYEKTLILQEQNSEEDRP